MLIKTDIEDDAGFQRLAEDVGRGVYASDPEFFLKDLKALIGDTVKRKAKKIKIVEALHRSDLSGQLSERDNVTISNTAHMIVYQEASMWPDFQREKTDAGDN